MNPIRCCVACKKREEKEKLFRIVSNNDGKAIIDTEQNNNSRGIYICKNKKCIESLQKAISKNKVHLKIKVENNSIIEVLKELGEEVWEN